MKNQALIWMVLLSSATGYLACQPGGKQAPNTTPPNQNPVFLYSFEEMPAKSTDDSRKLIKEFLGESDFKNLVQSEEGTVYFNSEQAINAHFEQDLKTGNFTFTKDMKRYMGDYAPKLPGANEAVKMAETFLRDKNLYPKNQAEVKLVHQGGLRAQNVMDNGKAGPVIDKMVTLTYGRVLDSMSVIGPGSKLVVQIGENGEVMGLVNRWRTLNTSAKKAVEPAAMISQREAEAQAKNQIAAEYGPNSSFTTKNAYKAYYDNNGNFIQPVYVFETTITLADKGVRPFDYLCVIPMLKNSPEPLQLITTDGRAKEIIRNVKKGEGSGTPSERKNKD